MRNISLLISRSRSITGNTDFTEDTGFQDEDFLEWATSAQHRIHSKIVQMAPDVFESEKVYSVTSGQEAYDIPELAHLNTRITQVDFSPSTSERDYYPLQKAQLVERQTGIAGNPSVYIRKSNQILLAPAPTSGMIRIVYQRRFPRLDIRRASVDSVVLDDATSTITSLVFDVTTLSSEDIVRIQDEGYVTIVDRDGVIQMAAIPVSEVNSSNGAVTLVSGFEYESGETIAVGDYVVLGNYTSTHSPLPSEVGERYLIEFMNWKAQKGDSSSDSKEQVSEVEQIEAEIISAYTPADNDVARVPIISYDYVDFQ